jgi:hypothetical protein
MAVPIRTNIVGRPSRLHRGNWNFIKRQAAIIARTYATYEPLKVFSYLALAFFIPGALLLLRAAFVFFARRVDEGFEASNLQALQVGSVLVVMALITFLIGLLADLVGGVRRVQQEILYRVRTMQVEDEAWRRVTTARMNALETVPEEKD